MSKLSRKRKRLPGPMTSTQAEIIPSISNSIRPPPIDRNEEFFRRQLEAAINESKLSSGFSENSVYCICHGEETPGMIGCDYCDEWYHPHCLNLNQNDVKRLSNENWSCPKCVKKKDDDNTHIKDLLPDKSSEDVKITNNVTSTKIARTSFVGENTKATENLEKRSDSEDEFIEEVPFNTPKIVKSVSNGTNLMKNPLHSKPSEYNTKSTVSTNMKNQLAQNSTEDFKKSDKLKKAKLVKTGFVGGNTKSTESSKKQSDRENENIAHLASNAPKAARSVPSRTNLVKNPLHSKPIESNKKSLISTDVKDELAQNSSESIKKSSLPSNASVLRSLSVPRKWKPPTMITGNTKCMNSRNSQTSPSAISKDTIGQLTPRLRVGLTRNFKSPKPLHASLKWTP